MRRSARKCTIWKVVVPPLMMIASPSRRAPRPPSRSRRFWSYLSASVTRKERRGEPPDGCGEERLGAAAHAAKLALHVESRDVAPDVASEACVQLDP